MSQGTIQISRSLILKILAALWLIMAAGGGALADFVEIERLLEKPAAELADKLEGQTVVVAIRNGAMDFAGWKLPQAVGLELAAALRRHHVDAIRAAADSRFEKLESFDRAFGANQVKTLKQTDRQALVGVEWLAKRPRFKIVAFSGSAKPVWTTVIDVPESALSMVRNVPPMNRAVIGFAEKTVGTSVREGDCTHLAEDALKAAGTGRRGPYLWGRQLGPGEPWLPGDIIQMERASVTFAGGSRSFNHHTAVIEEVRSEAVVVLHQNAFPAGKVVQRETWPFSGMKGYIAAFRPWDWPKENPMPPSCPVRATPALVVAEKKSKAPVNLLELIDPRNDRVRGIWFFEKSGELRSPREFEARLQVAVVPPKAYTLAMTIERLQGNECFGLGVTLGGRQTMLVVDAYKSTISGIHNLDGKPVNENESKKLGTFLPLNKRAQLTCQVRRDEILLDIDQQSVIAWQGDADRLSVSPDWPVPHHDWLFLGAFDSEFEISEFTLEVRKSK